MRTLFNIPSEKETRLWNKYMSNTYEQLNKPDSTVQDAGLFQGQVGRAELFKQPSQHRWTQFVISFEEHHSPVAYPYSLCIHNSFTDLAQNNTNRRSLLQYISPARRSILLWLD